jgi:hypothetical protein
MLSVGGRRMIGIRTGIGIRIRDGIDVLGIGNVGSTTFRCFLLLPLAGSAGDVSVASMGLMVSFLLELEKKEDNKHPN